MDKKKSHPKTKVRRGKRIILEKRKRERGNLEERKIYAGQSQ